VRSRPDIRIIAFAVKEFGALGGHVAASLHSWPCMQLPVKG
jgi:hypothetical protein